ncbi:PspA-associated protein PspAA [Nocardioides limicola]|uniref:PspA-associated protein PspAA n=1 Tax=Nocardioides limicola TaxID=2803368 RepID=UPI00193BBCCD|nr:hypothetical protein [Nocardioides sp. DJM-14]
MIIRILGEGQYDVSDEALKRLDQLDSDVEQAVTDGDEERFATAFEALLEGVRTVGVPHADDTLDTSDMILPPADASIDEVRALLTDDGLISG